MRLEVHESLRWTNQQKQDWQRYQPGQVVIFAPARERPASSATVVRVEKKKVVLALPSRKEMTLDLLRADSFDVARSRQIEVTPGDKILIRANDKRLGLTNGQVLAVSCIAQTARFKPRRARVFPRSFDNAATDMSSLLTKHRDGQPTMSSLPRNASLPKEPTWRAREADSPADKTRLTRSVPEEDRRATLDVLSESQSANAAVLHRASAWKQRAIDIAWQAQ